jgi:hypothetical protein
MLGLITTIVPVTQASAQSAPRTVTATCAAAQHQIANDLALIAHLNVQRNKPSKVLPKARRVQIDARIRQLEKNLVQARAMRLRACTTTLVNYAGKYSATFENVTINFVVIANNTVSGDIVSLPGQSINVATGVVEAQANFEGANCGTFPVLFYAKTGTATAHVSCTLGSFSRSGVVVAHRL